MRYHRRFGHFRSSVVDATNALVISKPWRMSYEDQVDVTEQWLERVSEAYNVPTPALVLFRDQMEVELFMVAVMQGTVDDDEAVIRLAHFSVVTLLYTFRKYMQKQNPHLVLLVGQRGQLVDEVSGELASLPDIETHTDPDQAEMQAIADGVHMSRLVPAEEIDARAWSISLFAKVAPRRFRRMVSAGRIMFVDPADVVAS